MPNRRRPLVLVADDDQSSREFLAAALHRDGFDIVQATNGRDALDVLRHEPVEVVLLDWKMPFLDGLQTLRAIRANDQFTSLPVILVTGSVDEAEKIHGLETGADDFLSKPVVVRELTARVRAQLRERAAWASDLDRARATRRDLAAAIEDLATEGSLLTIATAVAERLPRVLAIDGAAILFFAGAGVTVVAASADLALRFPPSSSLPAAEARGIGLRAASGPWLEAAHSSGGPDAGLLDVAFVPFRLGPTRRPLGCLVFALRPGAPAGPLSHRFRELIDATDFIVLALRPAIEQAETADSVITRIRRIIDKREFAIVLQPIVKLDIGETVAVEALSRFADQTAANVQFAQAASHGLGPTLERAAVAAAIDAAAPLPANIALSLNLSADVLQHDATLPELLANAHRPVIVELTEHERVDDYEAVRAALERLGPNVQLAIDDAGSGYASLRHILALRPSFVKLDIEWVRGIDTDPVRRALVSGLAYFATETGCRLVAEGIETPEELETVRGLGIELGQGHILGRPAPPP